MIKILKLLFLLGFCALISTLVSSLDFYKVPTGSMQPTIKPEDYIVTSTFNNYVHIIFPTQWISVNENSIYVFYCPNWKGQRDSSNYKFKGDVMVKRCIGTPNSIVYINKPSISFVNGYYSRVKKNQMDTMVFPHDTVIKWSYNNFGPLWIPKRGKSILLNSTNFKIYRDIIIRERKLSDKVTDSLTLSKLLLKQYVFKDDYYFMIGDNFYGSRDSRIWGLVPAENIIGQVICVF